MKQRLLLALLCLAAPAAWAQCVPGLPCGQTGGVIVPKPVGPGQSGPIACLDSLAAAGSSQLHAGLAAGHALTLAALSRAAISSAQVQGVPACNDVCANYDFQMGMWSKYAHASVGYLSEPDHTLQQAWSGKPMPVVPGEAQFNSCYPKVKLQAEIHTWCPGMGEKIGEGNTRLPNGIDGIAVCATPVAGLKHLNFTPAELGHKHQCARPQIADAFDRYTAERQCLDQALAQDAAAAAASKQAQANPPKPVAPVVMDNQPGARVKGK